MKYKYIQLGARLNLPGVSGQGLNAGSGKISANGRADGTFIGAVRMIVSNAKGYILEVPTGQHRGHYEVPNAMVQHASVELELDERLSLGLLTRAQYKLLKRAEVLQEEGVLTAQQVIALEPHVLKDPEPKELPAAIVVAEEMLRQRTASRAADGSVPQTPTEPAPTGA